MNTLELSENKEAVKARTQARNYSIEFLRFFFTAGVVVGHCWCIFYQLNEPAYLIWFHNACVDFFFVLSGYFMASHLELRKADEKYQTYVKYNFSRIRRLWPLMFAGVMEGILFELIYNLYAHKRFHFSTKVWGGFFFLGGLNNFDAGNVVWYISALFWCGLVLSAFLCFKRKISVFCYFPVSAFICLSFMNIWGNCNLASIPLIGNWFSVGLIRGSCGLIFGIEGFFLAVFIKENIQHFSSKAIFLFSLLIEIGFILLVFYLAVKQSVNNREFLMYFFTVALLIVFELHTEKIFTVFNKRVFGILGKISAWVYVFHFYIIKVMSFIPKMKSLPHFFVYASCVSVSFVISFFIYFLISKIAIIIKKFSLSNY